MQSPQYEHAFRNSNSRGFRIVLIFLPLILFVGILYRVQQRTIQQWDENIILSIQNYRTPFLDGLFQIITNSGGVGRGLPLLLVLVYFWWRRLRLEAWTLAGAAVFGQCITWSLKYVISRPRPNVIENIVLPIDPSFPSGHALGSAVLYGWLAVWMWQQDCRDGSVLMLIWVILVAFSRVYFGVHNPSDVIASLLLAVPWLTLVFTFYSWQKERQA
jgi:membrane-associated phospholipid phosphatase